MAELLLGAKAAQALEVRVGEAVERLAREGISPALGILRVGERPDDLAYERNVCRRCETLGIEVRRFALPADIPQKELLARIHQINRNDAIHGVLMFRPLPPQIDDQAACRALDPQKDVDGITDGSMAGVFAGAAQGFAPCTAQACMEILSAYGVRLEGKKAVVVGRSLVVGKPVAMMLLAQNATVTLCHSRTADLPAVCREADILIAAMGRAGGLGRDCFAPGQVVIDVGINLDGQNRLVGDVDFEQAQQVVAAITPVPGGVGTVTTAVLAEHVVQAAQKK